MRKLFSCSASGFNGAVKGRESNAKMTPAPRVNIK